MIDADADALAGTGAVMDGQGAPRGVREGQGKGRRVRVRACRFFGTAAGRLISLFVMVCENGLGYAMGWWIGGKRRDGEEKEWGGGRGEEAEDGEGFLTASSDLARIWIVQVLHRHIERMKTREQRGHLGCSAVQESVDPVILGLLRLSCCEKIRVEDGTMQSRTHKLMR
jgi:hypothetical protein